MESKGNVPGIIDRMHGVKKEVLVVTVDVQFPVHTIVLRFAGKLPSDDHLLNIAKRRAGALVARRYKDAAATITDREEP